jgi:hypothetical protein
MRQVKLNTIIQNNEKLIEAVFEVVKGQKPWEYLKEAGLNISFYNSKWEISSVSFEPIKLGVKDFAEGVIRNVSNKENIHEWASFLLAASSLIEFDVFDESENGKKLLDCLWDLSFKEDGAEFYALEISKEIMNEKAGGQVQ